MARAYFELDEAVVDEEIDGRRVTTTVTERRALHRGLPAPAAMTAPLRSRWQYYLSYALASLVFVAGVACWAWSIVDDVTTNERTGAAFALIGGAALLASVAHDVAPQICTCESHHLYYGCPPHR